jgi:hypothetical protein
MMPLAEFPEDIGAGRKNLCFGPSQTTALTLCQILIFKSRHRNTVLDNYPETDLKR